MKMCRKAGQEENKSDTVRDERKTLKKLFWEY